MSNLPIKEERHEEEQPECKKYGAEMKEVGEEKVYDELVFVLGEIYVRRHIVKKYKCKKCGQNPENDALNSYDIEQQRILHLLLHLKSHKSTKKHIRNISIRRSHEREIFQKLPPTPLVASLAEV